MKSVKEYGAIGNGIADETKAFLAALNSEEPEISIPEGEYLIFDTLYIPSNKTIIADKNALIKCADECFQKETSFLLCNKDKENGNQNITIRGGIWDGNNINNMCTTYCTGAQTGVLLDFINVDGLEISDVVLQNSERFHIRINQVTHFTFTNIYFNDTQLRPCNDGINMGGFCEFGTIKGIRARCGATNDDLIAMNADDTPLYCMNRGRKIGFIRNITIEDVYAENVYTAVRMLSVTSEISNITIKNLHCGIREYGLNLDASRYCEDPFFNDADYPDGVGNMHDIYLEDITLYKTEKSSRPICTFETNVENFVIKNMKFIDNQFHALGKPSFVFAHMRKSNMELNGEAITIPAQQPKEIFENQIKLMKINAK